ncbi:28S ribosomal protein S28, mitochondrial-like [Stylophora pistillata]|uniref:28S ribosomal protein S28, mitochondrial-like n=1 Tax=Stylophora pistillata TaxID=50429 RepID=UPI000C03C257|nr:28S ribosomal protein S28, mitochondrial-like [Stylophora pistillata]
MAVSYGLWRKALSLSYFRRYCRTILLTTDVGIRSCFSAPRSAEDENFEEMLRNSKFVKLGRPKGKTVSGRITHIVENDGKKDLYVDFGWKFHTVCTEGRNIASQYKVNDLVKIKLINLEAAEHFLGQTRHITLCEADAKLEGKLELHDKYSVMEKKLS